MGKRRSGFRCYECDAPADCAHHILPLALGGRKTIPLCNSCHGKVHGMDFTNHSALIKAGQERAKKEGRLPGRPSSEMDIDLVKELRAKGLSWQEIADETGYSKTTAHRRHDENS